MSNDYLLRSLMFVPGHNKKMISSASRSNADAIILDLEDSVKPLENKENARMLIRETVQSGILSGYYVFPRINDRESGLLLRDVYCLTIDGIDGFIYPKAKHGEDIYFFDKLLETIEYEKGLPIGQFKIIPLIETASAVMNAVNICQASSRVIALAFGCEDFVADLVGIHDSEGQSIFVARSLISMAARANGLIPIDTVNIHVHDLEHLKKNLITAKELGFEGMLILHPKEIELVHKFFSPSEDEIRESSEIISLYEDALKNNKGVVVVNNKFVGPPMVLAAKKTLNRFELIKRRSKNSKNNV